jgi:predicted chitinase
MADLKHDSSGFLVGPKLTDDLDKISRELELLRAIRGDTSETVNQLGRIFDALSGIDAVGPSEPTRPAGSPNTQEERLSRTMAPALPGAANDPASSPASASTVAPVGITAQLTTQAPAIPATAQVARPPAGPAPAKIDSQAPVIADPGHARRDREKMEQKRQANGRFGSEGVADTKGDESRAAKALSAAGESLKNAGEGLASGADNIDPAVSAAKELGGIVAPVIGTLKPLGRLFGRSKSPEEKAQRQNTSLLRRIWGELREGNKKSGGGRMGLLLTGLMSLMGMLLAPLRALSRIMGLTRALGALAGLAKGLGGLRGARGAKGSPVRDRRAAVSERGRRTAEANRVRRNPETGRFESQPGAKPAREGRTARAGKVGADGKPATAASKEVPGQVMGPDGKPAKGKPGAAPAAESAKVAKPSRLGKVAGGAAKLGKGLLRKLPFIGALLGAGMFASAAMAKDDPGASAEERAANKKDRWGTMGGVAGGMLGGVLGMFGGPAGAIAGGMLGDQLGTAVGEWLSTVDMTSMIADITSTFHGWADSASKMASGAFDYVQGKWGDLVASGSKVLSSMGDWVKEKWGKVAETYNNVKDEVGDKVQTAKDYVGDKATKVKDAGQNALNTLTGGRYTGGSNARKDELIKAMDAGGITDPQSKAALMANVDHESQGFTKKEENLNYSAKRLQEVFPKYYKDADSARADAGNPEAIANKVYGGRMGNTDPGDGFKFRGRGDIQLTGKDQYAAMGKKLGIDLVNNPELASDPKYSAQIAVQHWKESGADALASKGDIKGARVKTNGGTNGLDDVTAKYDKYLAQAQAGDLTPTRQANEVRVPAPAAANDAINGTMAMVKGQPSATAGVAQAPTPLQNAPGKLSQAQPIGVLPIPASTAAPVSPSANPGSVLATAPSMMLSTAAPANVAPIQVPSYSAPAPDAGKARIDPTPQVTKPMTPAKAPAAPANQMMVPLTQNLADRGIAHAATGGIGMSGTARL